MLNKRSVYDFTFILPGFVPIPPGGYMVVFELSKYLTNRGYKVLIIFLKRMHRNLYNIEKEEELLNKIKADSLKSKVSGSLQNTLYTQFLISLIRRRHSFLKTIWFKLSRDSITHSDGTFLSKFSFDNIDYFVRKRIPKKLETRRLIATAWETSYFVDRFCGCKFKYYLVQHDEDNPVFSGRLNGLAHKSYDFPLKKIVINKQMQERFSLESPIKITVAAHVIGKVLNKPEMRNNKVILMQLREGTDKGAGYAIEAARLIKTKRPEIEIISFGNYRGDLPEFIKHLGFVSNAEYIELFNLATIFVLPSLVEGFSTPVLEAMSCGCVPVATKCGGPENFVEHQVNGLLVSIKDSHGIADEVIWLLENTNRRIEMADRAIETAKGFSEGRMGEELIDGILKYERSLTNNF